MAVTHRAFAVRALLLLAAAVLIAFGAYGYLSHARNLAIAEFKAAASAAGLRPQFELTSFGLGRAALRNVEVVNDASHWKLRLDTVQIRFSPMLGSPRRIEVNVPLQHASLRRSDLVLESQLRADALLTRVSRLSVEPDVPLVVLNSANLSAQHGVLRARTRAARELQLSLNLETESNGISGPLKLRGSAGGALLQLAHADGAARWLFPQALDAAFELDARIVFAVRSIRLEQLHASFGGIGIEGELVWKHEAPDGVLLLTTDTRRIGIELSGGEAHLDLAPGTDWLEQHRGRWVATNDFAHGAPKRVRDINQKEE